MSFTDAGLALLSVGLYQMKWYEDLDTHVEHLHAGVAALRIGRRIRCLSTRADAESLSR